MGRCDASPFKPAPSSLIDPVPRDRGFPSAFINEWRLNNPFVATEIDPRASIACGEGPDTGGGGVRSEGRATVVRGVYRLHAREARRLAYLLTGSQEQADDLTQDAFIRAYGRLAHLRSEDSFAPYLRRVVVNLARMQFRRRAVERRYLVRQRAERSVAAHSDSEGDDRLRDALGRLPYRQRAAVVLRFYIDLPDEETAEVLGCTTGSVRSLISRGVAALRDDLGGEGHG